MTVKLYQSDAKPVTRETGYCWRGRNVMIRLPWGGKTIEFRLKRTKKVYVATVEQCYYLAVQNKVQEIKQARLEARKAKRLEKGR